jgi:hypothetical protein
MIGKHITNPKSGGSFKGLNDYISGKSKRRIEGEKVAFADCLNLISVDTATAEMEAIAFQNKRMGNPVMHLLLSWREGENPDRGQVKEAVEITLNEMNLSQCQAVYALHQNTDNMHLHICVNRVAPDTLKAINPSHGWTRKGMERAARRIEYAQGWGVENNAWSGIDEHGELIQKAFVSEKVIPQPVKDKENLTGEQSAMRKEQDALKGAVKGLKSWKEFHALVRSNGMEYEKKGSGAIIRVGQIVIKASAASRNLGLTKLEKLFGEYEPAIDDIDKPLGAERQISEPRPLDSKNDNDLWKAYISERNSYLKNKREVRRQISAEHDEQKRGMKQRQAAERGGMYRAYAGRPRYEIYEQRKILATRHAYEAVLLKESHKGERNVFQKKNPGFTATYEQWLRDRGLDCEAEAWRHRKDENYFRFEISGEGEAQSYIKGLPGFKAAAAWRGATRFYRDETPGVTAFTDTGQKIRVYQCDDEAILAALQLGQQKWGGVHLDGTDEYKRRCAEIAAQHGIRVTNPEPPDVIKPQEGHDTAERTKAQTAVPLTGMVEKEAAPVREPAMDAPDAQNIPMEAEREASKPQLVARPMRLADRRKTNTGAIAALRSRREEIEETLDAEAKAIADAAIENLKKSAGEKRKRLEASKAATANAVREAEGKEPAKGLFGFGYSARKAEWDKLLKKARSDDARAGKAIEEHGKALDSAVPKAVESSKGAARSKNAEAVKEIEAIDAEINELNGDVNGIYSAARVLLKKSEYHQFSNVRFPEEGSAYRGEILGIAEYNGYAAVLQDGPTERTETGREDIYGRRLFTANHIVWAHEISPEQAPEMEALIGCTATIAAGAEGEIQLADVCTTKQEQERSRNRGFSR